MNVLVDYYIYSINGLINVYAYIVYSGPRDTDTWVHNDP